MSLEGRVVRGEAPIWCSGACPAVAAQPLGVPAVELALVYAGILLYLDIRIGGRIASFQDASQASAVASPDLLPSRQAAVASFWRRDVVAAS